MLSSIPESGRSPWKRAYQPIPVFLPGESHGQRSQVGYSPWGHTELDMTKSNQTTTETPWSEAGTRAELNSRRGKWCLTLATPGDLHEHVLSSQGSPLGVVSVHKHRPATLLSGVEGSVCPGLSFLRVKWGWRSSEAPAPGRGHTPVTKISQAPLGQEGWRRKQGGSVFTQTMPTQGTAWTVLRPVQDMPLGRVPEPQAFERLPLLSLYPAVIRASATVWNCVVYLLT